MSHVRVHQWACDRCAAAVELVGNNGSEQPDGWARICITTPPLASPLEGTSVEPGQHLCAACVEGIRRWMKRADT